MATPERNWARGSVWGLEFVEGDPPKPVVVVSNGPRNASGFPKVHVVRITSRAKPPWATVVELGPADPVQGRAMCDEVEPVPKDDLVDHPGGGAMLSRRTMERIDHALRIVLDL